MKQRSILVSITLLVLVLLMVVSCGPASTPAAPSTPAPSVAPAPSQGRATTGTLAKIDGNTLTLTAAQGPVTVNVSSSTAIQKTVAGSLADIQEGVFIFASGERDAKGNVTATTISIQGQDQTTRPTFSGTPPSQGGTTAPQRERTGAVGSVTKIEGAVLTLSTAAIVTISSGAVIQKTVTGSLADLREGQSLSVRGIQDAGGNIAATSIRIQSETQVAPNSPAK
jgi:hypothetical protein